MSEDKVFVVYNYINYKGVDSVIRIMAVKPGMEEKVKETLGADTYVETTDPDEALDQYTDPFVMGILIRAISNIGYYTITVRVEKDTIYQRAVDAWGVKAQMEMVVEECAEAILAIKHYGRNRITAEDMVEEFVDVYLMAKQMEYVFPLEFKKKLTEKVERLNKRLLKVEAKQDGRS